MLLGLIYSLNIYEHLESSSYPSMISFNGLQWTRHSNVSN